MYGALPTRILLVIASILAASCSTSQETVTKKTTPTYSPPANFDAAGYKNPKNFGYDLTGSSKNVLGKANTSFAPIYIDVKKMQSRIIYPKKAMRNKIQGKVILELYVDSTGTLTNIKVIKSPHSLLTESTKDAVLQSQLKPATLNGKPVNSFIRVSSRYRM